ncbi:MAG: glycosyl transferase family 2 [Nitrospira sp.]|nr:MAG: glycosyl transferase family 2 [Nitrospira sp.]
MSVSPTDMSLTPYSFSVIMPVYYEGPGVIPAVTTLMHTIKYRFELVIVYDKEDDPTVGILQGMSKDYANLRLVRNTEAGVISAIKVGIAHSVGDNVAIWCAYHVDPYGILNQMYEMILSGCDVVSANRFGKVMRFSRGGLIKKILSRGGNFILWRLVGSQFGDTTTSIKMYRREFLEKHPITTHAAGGWALSTELAMKAAVNDYKLGEVVLSPHNINLIRGLSRFKVVKFLPHYLKWVMYGIRNRDAIFNNRLIRRENART